MRSGRAPVVLATLAALTALAAATPPLTRAQETAPPKAETCAACHGPEGNPSQPQYPTLAGQNARYLYLQLRDFKEGRRSDPQMSPMAAGLERSEMQALADWFSKRKPTARAFRADPEKVRLGKAKADETLCTMCHLGGFSGQNEIPRVAGQSYEYIVKQLTDFKARRRTNDAGNMTSVAGTLSSEDIENLAQYIATL